MRVIILIFIALCIIPQIGFLHAEPTIDSLKISAENTEILNYMASLFCKDELSKKDINYLEEKIDSDFVPCAMFASVVLYKNDQKKYEEAIIENFYIDDYADRRAGKFDLVGMEKLDKVMTVSLDNKLIEGYRFGVLFTFWYYRNRNAWSEHEKIEEKISAARLMRSIYFAYIFRDEKFNSLELLNKIDGITKKRMKDKDLKR